MSSRSRWKTLELGAIGSAIVAGSLLRVEGASAQQFSVTSWGHKDGLASTTVYAVAQTGNGFLWLATGDGLIRFDGFQFLPPELPGADREALGRITALSPTAAEALLIGTSAGVLIRREARTSARVVLDSSLERIQELADHTFRVWTLHKVYRLANTSLAILSTQDSQEPETAADRLAADPDISPAQRRAALSDRSLTATIRKTVRDTRGALWIATESQGLLRITRDGELRRFTRSAGLPSDHLWDLFEDREGNLWVGTQNGLARLRQDKFVTYRQGDGLLADVAIALAPAADAGVWIGYRSGLQHFTAPGGPDDTPLPAMAVADLLALGGGGLLVSTDSGIRELAQELRVPQALSKLPHIEQMAQSANGDLWLYGQQAGLWYYKQGAAPERVNEPAVGSQAVLSLEGGQQDQVWLGLEDGTVILRPPVGSHVFTAADGLTGGAVRFLSAQPDGSVWVASDKGLAYFDGERFRRWDRSSGLPSDRLLWAIPDRRGNVWLGYSTGVARLSIDTLLHASSRSSQLQYEFYDDGDGLKSNPESYGRSPVALASDGRLWVSMSEGIGVIDSAHIPRDTVPPPVHILGLTADGHEVAPTDGLAIPANTRTLEIAYTGISLSEPRKVRFRYRLEGFDHDWQDAGARRNAFYTNLRPGRYRFQVLATNNGRTWNDAGDSVRFELLPAFYQTPWFLLLCALAALSLVLVAYRLRLSLAARELQARYEERISERTRIAQDLHDSLVQEILGISLQLEIADEMIPSESTVKAPLRRALDLSRTALANGRSALHVLRRKPFTRADIENTLRDTVQSMTGSRDTVHFDSSGTERPIRTATGEELTQIVRESLRNAILHAGPDNVGVRWDYGRQHLVFVVRDSGPGISEDLLQAGKPGHFGIRGMRERAARIESSLTVNTSPGAGTEWTLRVPASIAYEPEDGGTRS